MSKNMEGIKGVAVGRSDTYRLAPADIHVKDGWNCRTENFNPDDPDDLALAQSIAEVGVKANLTVYWLDGKAFVSDGHRRLFATQYAIEHLGAEIKSLPVQTEDRYASEADRVFSQIVRNSGKPLRPIEQAKVFKRLVDLGWTESDIAQKSGLTRQWVVDLLNLQAAPETMTRMVRDGSVSATLAVNALKQSAGDAAEATSKLTQAVETARAEGKTRATAKHMGGEKKSSLKQQLQALFGAAEIREAKDNSGRYVVVLVPDAYAELRTLVGF
ncbi:hypothetical protein [Mesorhizobium sp. B2-8-9]|uniref:ParB/RepB/Spo0J family partition protein n=1 Tax=Mesorhizobium sp. B2-8-9 TaxID=2589899 RepID=UPI0011286D85|nr:hypothetical protein [Mesorhizobium sp. B2-8-9]TPI86393.1 hypothetical protein FJ423_00795 [Mesorhizobium sp. B2-8-9]